MLAVQDWPDFSSRGVILDLAYGPSLMAMAIDEIIRLRITAVHLVLSGRGAPEGPWGHSLLSHLRDLHAHCSNHAVNLVPALVVTDAAAYEDFLNGGLEAALRLLMAIPEKSLSLIIGEGIDRADVVKVSIACISRLSTMLQNGPWTVHLWGLSSAELAEVDHKSNGSTSLALIGHEAATEVKIPPSGEFLRCCRYGRYVTGECHGTVLQVRRALIGMVHTAEAALSVKPEMACSPAGFMIWSKPINNPLCPLLVSSLLSFVGAGIAWNCQGTSAMLGCVEPAPPSLMISDVSTVSATFATRQRRLSEQGSPTAGSSVAAHKGSLQAIVENLLSWSPRPVVSGTAGGEGRQDDVEEALFRITLNEDVTKDVLEGEHLLWREGLVSLHRLLHALAKASPAPELRGDMQGPGMS
jgi:hypothetical protein